MEKASTVITDALQELLIQASEAPIEADEAQTAIRYLNRMMARLDAQGVSLGYTVVSNLSDDVTVPDGALDGVVTNLAIALAKQYGATPTADLAQRAMMGMDAMRELAFTMLQTSYGPTLPVGSGNEGDATLVDHFYPDDEDAILTETNGYIATESGTGE